jgi:hypothetical protein
MAPTDWDELWNGWRLVPPPCRLIAEHSRIVVIPVCGLLACVMHYSPLSVSVVQKLRVWYPKRQMLTPASP